MFCLIKVCQCYKSLKEGLGTHAPSRETVRLWVNVIKNGWQHTDDAPHSEALTKATDKRHMKEGKSVLEYTCSILGTAMATEVRISPAIVYSILANSSKTWEVCAK